MPRILLALILAMFVSSCAGVSKSSPTQPTKDLTSIGSRPRLRLLVTSATAEGPAVGSDTPTWFELETMNEVLCSVPREYINSRFCYTTRSTYGVESVGILAGGSVRMVSSFTDCNSDEFIGIVGGGTIVLQPDSSQTVASTSDIMIKSPDCIFVTARYQTGTRFGGTASVQAQGWLRLRD